MATRTTATVKFRPEDTMSERQLVLALAAHGRTVALGQVAAWRKDGLLPPLASCGTGSGRSYYWREPDILAQAECVHDAMARHGRADTTVITLWLHGFAVPLPRLRRAWQHRARMKAAPRLHKAGGAVDTRDALPVLLLKALLGLGMTADDRALTTLLPLLQRMGTNHDTNPMVLGVLAVLTAAALENGAMMRDASDGALLSAQRHMRSVLTVLGTMAEPAMLTETLGPGLFLLILALLHSGQGALLDALLAQLPARNAKENGAGRHAPGPAPHPYQITA